MTDPYGKDYADEVLRDMHSESIDLDACENIADTMFEEDFDENDDYYNELMASGDYADFADFDDADDIDEDFIL